MGMYGILRIDPEGYEPADKEYFMTVKEWDSQPNRMMAGEDAQYSPRQRNPDVFTINGKSVPRSFHPEKGSAPLRAPNGDPQETTPYATTAVTVLELLGLLLDGVVMSFSPSRSADPDRNG